MTAPARPGPRSLSIGKQRRLAQIADSEGRFALVAADQRGNLRRALAPEDPSSVPYADLVRFKGEVIEAIGPHVTGVLVDPEFGAAQIIRSGQLPGSSGLIVAMEETGYQEASTDRRTVLIDGFDASKAVRMGASAAKLLLYFHPDASRAASQIQIVADVAADCAKAELPLVVEPLHFSLDAGTPLSSEERRRVIIETARQLSTLDIDMLKMEFPVDSNIDHDRQNWAEACTELTEASEVPWLLLSAGVGFDLFAAQARIACNAGASGVLAGRAVWREATEVDSEQRHRFLAGMAVDRMLELRNIVTEHARSAWSVYADPEPVVDRWFEDY